MGVGGVSISKSSEWHLITEGMILLMSGSSCSLSCSSSCL